MRFLRHRLGSTEGSYFKEESELKATKLKERLQPGDDATSSGQSAPSTDHSESGHVDVLPEILSHQLPLSGRPSALLDARHGLVDRGVDGGVLTAVDRMRATQGLPPLLAGLVGHAPRARMGRGNNELSASGQVWPRPSTANEMRPRGADKATAEGVSQALKMVTKAFAVATVVVAGAAALATVAAFRALDIKSLADLPSKGRAAAEPGADAIRRWFRPLHKLADQLRMSPEERDAVGLQFAKTLGARKEAGWSGDEEQIVES